MSTTQHGVERDSSLKMKVSEKTSTLSVSTVGSVGQGAQRPVSTFALAVSRPEAGAATRWIKLRAQMSPFLGAFS